MPSFAYTARDSRGQALKGALEASSEQTARARLRDMGYLVTAVSEQRERRKAGVLGFGQRVKLNELVVFTMQFATLIEAGISIVSCLETLAEQAENPLLKETLADIKTEVERGGTLSDALAKHPKIFSDLYISLVRSGETGGQLDQVLSRLGTQLDKEHELRQKVKAAFTYPVAVGVLAFGIVTFLLIFVVPVFARVYGERDVKLPLPTLVLMGVSNFFVHYWYVIFLGIIFLIWVYRIVSRSKTARPYIDRIKLKIPLFGKLSRKVAIGQFVSTLGALVSGGVPLLEALTVAGRAANNIVILEAIEQVSASITEGESFADPLQATGEFPPMVSRMIAVGEESGNLDEMLTRISQFYERDVEYTVRHLTTLLEPVLTISLGLVVGFIVISMYLPIFTLVKVIRE